MRGIQPVRVGARQTPVKSPHQGALLDGKSHDVPWGDPCSGGNRSAPSGVCAAHGGPLSAMSLPMSRRARVAVIGRSRHFRFLSLTVSQGGHEGGWRDGRILEVRG